MRPKNRSVCVHKFHTFPYKYIYTQVNELTERVSKAEQQTEKEKVQLGLLMDTHENLTAELQNTKQTLAKVTEERDEAREIIIQLREHYKTLSRKLSENIEFKEITTQRNEGTVQVQKRIRLSER